jgi:hypothetical protein
MNTFYIANNKTGLASILQTNKTSDEIWNDVETDIDIVMKFDTVEQAQNIILEQNMQYVPYDNFVK